MSDIPADAFVPRDEGAEILASNLAAVRKTEGERRFIRTASFASGWVVAVVFLGFHFHDQQMIANRPVPQDKIWISFVDASGMPIQEAKPVADMTISEREGVTMQFMTEYTVRRLGYTWESQQRNYDWVRFTTYSQAQQDYITEMTVSPNRPSNVLKETGEIKVAWTGEPNRTGPFSFEVPYKIQVRSAQGVWGPEIKRRAKIAYHELASMPAEIAHRIDPLRLIVTRFSTEPWEFDPSKVGAGQ